MEIINKILGAQCQLIAASGVTEIKEGYRAYSFMTRKDNTQISSVTKIENDTGATGVVSGESWMNENLLAGIDYISFEDPIISVTMASGTPSILAYLEPRPISQ